jgi:hypothetical protein
MRASCIAAIVFLIGQLVGCSGISQSERGDFTRPEAREKYLAGNPQCRYHEQIQNGEIMRGMDIYEVIASWGLPNVYIPSGDERKECWIYYVQQRDSKSVLIYTLRFDGVLLYDWDIDQKRFDDYRIVSEMGAETREAVNAEAVTRRKY